MSYLIESLANLAQRYVGLTIGLKQRIREHNAGKSMHTAKYRSWRVT